jgi:hypothetical protein
MGLLKRAESFLFPSGISLTGRVQFLIFLIAVIVRVALVSQFAMPPYNDALWADAVGWNLVQGNGFSASQSEPRVPGIFRTPAYPFFLAFIYWIAGHSYTAVHIAQALLDAASAVLLGRIIAFYLTPGMAIFSSFLYAIYPYPGMFCGVVHQDILLVFCTLATLLLTSKAAKSASLNPWFFTGLSLGVLALVKANMLLFALLPVITIFHYFKENRILRSLILMAGMAVMLSPWVIRNYLVFHSFPPLAAGATGTNLRLLVLELDGGEAAVRNTGISGQPMTDPRNLRDGPQLIKEEKILAQNALQELKRRWPEYCLNVMRHIPRLWITTYSRYHSELVGVIGSLLSFFVLGLGLAGMVILRKNWRGLLPLYLTVLLITAIYAPYTVEARYTLPARPVMLCFVASALAAAMRKKDIVLQESSYKS